jgi:hypothetical protein
MYSTAVILSVITGTVLTPIAEIQTFLSFMTGDDIYTHQIPRALDACAPALRAQFPQWQDVKTPRDLHGWEAVHAWLARFPQEDHTVTPLAVWQHRDPAAELAEMAGGVERVIVIGNEGRN